MSDRNYKLNLTAAAIVFLLVCLWAVLSSCKTAEGVARWNDRHLNEAAKYCAKTFPIKETIVYKDSVHFDTLVKEGLHLIDTIYTEGDTVILHRNCPPSEVVTKYLTKTVTKTQEDSAKLRVKDDQIKTLGGEIRAKEKEIAVLQDNVKEAKERVKEKATEIWWHRLVIIALLVWIFRRPLLSLINPIKKFYPF